MFFLLYKHMYLQIAVVFVLQLLYFTCHTFSKGLQRVFRNHQKEGIVTPPPTCCLSACKPSSQSAFVIFTMILICTEVDWLSKNIQIFMYTKNFFNWNFKTSLPVQRKITHVAWNQKHCFVVVPVFMSYKVLRTHSCRMH